MSLPHLPDDLLLSCHDDGFTPGVTAAHRCPNAIVMVFIQWVSVRWPQVLLGLSDGRPISFVSVTVGRQTSSEVNVCVCVWTSTGRGRVHQVDCVDQM